MSTTNTSSTDGSSCKVSGNEQWTLDIEKYIEETKPDPLQIQQIRAWQFDCTTTRSNNNNKIDTKVLNFDPDISTVVQFTWKACYVQVVLDIHIHSNETNLVVSIVASARLVNSNNNNKKNSVHTKMLQRLKQDDYIAKLINNKNTKPVLCQVHILETCELVHTSESVAEAIRRSVYSAADSPLDIVHLLTCLPFFSSSNKLGVRARLKILEDAAVDACEEYNSHVEELSLQPQQEDDDCPTTTTTTSKNKRTKLY